MNQFRQLYAKVINDKHDDVMAKFGAILAQGILDAGRSPNRVAVGLSMSVTERENEWICGPACLTCLHHLVEYKKMCNS